MATLWLGPSPMISELFLHPPERIPGDAIARSYGSRSVNSTVDTLLSQSYVDNRVAYRLRTEPLSLDPLLRVAWLSYI